MENPTNYKKVVISVTSDLDTISKNYRAYMIKKQTKNGGAPKSIKWN